MRTNYKGESDAKKIARSMFWDEVIQRWDATGRYDPQTLVLGGTHGGDIGVLLSECFDPGDITAVDIDEGKIDSLTARWPEVQVVNTNALRYCADIDPKTLDIVFLDFCGRTNPALASTLGGIAARTISDRGMFCVGFSYSREKPDEMHDISLARHKLQALTRGWAKQQTDAMARALVFLKHFAHGFNDSRRSLLLRGTSLIAYNSRPTPMFYLVTEVHPCHSRAIRDGKPIALGVRADLETGVVAVPLDVSIRDYVTHPQWRDHSAVQLSLRFFPEVDERIGARRIAAWRAHATRRKSAA